VPLMSTTHLRGNTAVYHWKEYYGDGEKRFLHLTGYKELCKAMQTREAESVADPWMRFSIERNGVSLHYTHEELLQLLIAAEGNTRK